MWPDRVSNPGPLTYESGALPIVLRGPFEVQRQPYVIPFVCIRICLHLHVHADTCLQEAVYKWLGQKKTHITRHTNNGHTC